MTPDMTPEAALVFLKEEFLSRFGLDAELCCDPKKTTAAVAALAEALGVPNPLLADPGRRRGPRAPGW